MRNIKKAVLVILTIVFLMMVTINVIVYFMGDKIKAYAVEKINEQLAVKIKVNQIDISFAGSFPHLGLRFQGVSISESTKITGRPILKAQNVLLAFNVWDAIRGKYKVSRIVIESALADLAINSKGIENFQILKDTAAGPDKKEEPLNIDLKKIVIRKSIVKFRDDFAEKEVALKAGNLVFGGKFNDRDFLLKAKGDLVVEKYREEKAVLVKNRNLVLDAHLRVKDGKHFALEKNKLSVDGLNFTVDGGFSLHDDYSLLDLAFEGKNLDIQSFISLLPESYVSEMKDFQSVGNFYFRAKLKGRQSETESPSVNVDFGIEKGEIKQRKISKQLDNVRLKGHYSNGVSRNLTTSVLKLDRIEARLGGREFKGRMELSNFNDPVVDLEAEGDINLADVRDFVDLDGVNKMSGDLSLNLKVAGKVADLSAGQSFSKASVSGFLRFGNIEFEQKGNPVACSKLTGNIRMAHGNVETDGISGFLSGNDFDFHGKFLNLVPFVLNEGQKLIVEGTWHSREFNATGFFAQEKETGLETSKSSAHDNPQDYSILERVNVNFNLKIDHLKIYNFDGRDLSCQFLLSNNHIRAKDLDFNSMGGKFNISGNILYRPGQNFMVTASMHCADIEISQLFYQCADFGQEGISHKNIKGKLTSDIQFACLWDNKLEADLDKLYTLADLKITNGELVNYEPLKSLSAFVKVHELQNVKFATLENQIEIKDSRIYIPSMQINNNALNLTISGTHTFENYLDYKIRVRLNDILANKYNWRVNRREEEVEEDAKGGLSAFIIMKGPIDNISISYDKLTVKKKVAESFKLEKKNLVELIKNEFGSDKTGEPKPKEDKKKEEPANAGGFGWDE